INEDTFLQTCQLRPGEAYRVRPGRVVLRVCDGPQRGKELRVVSRKIRGGRSELNDLVVDDGSISGVHFELILEEQGVLLRDLGSTNGTWVGAIRVREAWIEPGTTFRAGRCGIEFCAAEDVEVPLSAANTFDAMLGHSPVMRELFALLERVAGTPMDVLVGGETGTGKELVARGIHARSTRSQGPFVVLDGSSLPRDLAEAAILGHRKGAFTGAFEARPGCFEEADGGTVFIDEIGELPLDLQPKLLRVLERREVQRIGETKRRPIDVRVVAATHRDLPQMVSRGEFREDLYFRLSDYTVELPPLRDRSGDAVVLARAFLATFDQRTGRTHQLTPEAEVFLGNHPWPGNVRELQKTIRRAAFLAEGPAIDRIDLEVGGRPGATANTDTQVGPAGDIDEMMELPFKAAKVEFERRYLGRLLTAVDNNLSEAARRLGYSRQGLRDRLKRLGIYRREP
ncbi:MAG: sigma 54-interacting transcriptional regulator, partial [Nannocystaceae bacterium]